MCKRWRGLKCFAVQEQNRRGSLFQDSKMARAVISVLPQQVFDGDQHYFLHAPKIKKIKEYIVVLNRFSHTQKDHKIVSDIGYAKTQKFTKRIQQILYDFSPLTAPVYCVSAIPRIQQILYDFSPLTAPVYCVSSTPEILL